MANTRLPVNNILLKLFETDIDPSVLLLPLLLSSLIINAKVGLMAI